MIFFVAQAILLFAVALLALARGGGPERFVAAVLSTWFLGNAIARRLFGTSSYVSFEGWVFLTDLIAFAIFMGLALRANRYWTLWVASAQLLAVVGHLLGGLGLTEHPLVYSIFVRLPFWLQIFLLCLGTLGARASNGRPKPWKPVR
ncbi:hypothetical protein [Alteriqipengyuania lutimaris]|uniref:hypothetical protein n=1 Tax=Alteriqipengyuania lutimaris TaxID=1538146 RepID=UPI001CFD5FE1|nr:hypothetical protein [Alteriqipengyuania lutimaris]